jgi:hypothetical protein
LIIRLIIQTILLYLSGAVWTDGPSNVSRLDPSEAIQIDAEHPTRNRKAEFGSLLGLQNRRSEGISGIADGAAVTGGHALGWIIAPQPWMADSDDARPPSADPC